MQGAEPLVPFHLFILHLLAIFQRTEAISLDARVVDEYVLPLGIDEEAESLLHVEPFDRANQHRSSHNSFTAPKSSPRSCSKQRARAATSQAGQKHIVVVCAFM